VVTRQDVQRAAVALFAAKGFAATGIRELGSTVGVNSGTLYHHAGGGKPELLSTIMRDCLEALLEAGREAAASSPDPGRQLAALIAAHVGFSVANPLTARVTDQEMRALDPATHAELVAMRDDYESLFSAVLARGEETGVFQLADLRLARLALLEMCNGVSHWYRPDGRLTSAEVQRHFMTFAGRLVGCDPADWHDIPPPEPVRLAIEPPTATTITPSTKEPTA
jgi:AcrR family transcriptional regulator